ncbi:MAG TPA: hypothetical protein VG329_03450 [Candidatus Dormibacteraeota bacterium]|nr:hypothetical protein [Candidatus Dormibacteraeota bacterium]
MRERVVLRIPTREWAVDAIDDLRGEGFEATLLDPDTCDGPWRLLVEGPADMIARMRQAVHGPIQPFCWETWVNQSAA